MAVLVRIVANPLSNVFQKLLAADGFRPTFIILATHALLSVACSPVVLASPLPRSPEFWFNIVLCAALAVAANALLVAAVKRADLSVLGPINAYKAVVSLMPAVVLLGEVPPPLALAGIGLILLGSYFLSDPAPPHDAPAPRQLLSVGVQLRIAALVLSAIEAVFLKRALAVADPLTTFVWWAVLGLAAALVPTLLSRPRSPTTGEPPKRRRAAPRFLALAGTTGLMQYGTLATFAELQVAASLSLFQTSALVSVVLGHHVFREPHFRRRLAASAVMVAGAALIIAARA